jgi:hypothetical protein
MRSERRRRPASGYRVASFAMLQTDSSPRCHDPRALQAYLGHENKQHPGARPNWRWIGSRTTSGGKCTTAAFIIGEDGHARGTWTSAGAMPGIRTGVNKDFGNC